jgi:hypothetical protein
MGMVYTNIQVDVCTTKSELLSQAYVDCLRDAINELLLPCSKQTNALATLEAAVIAHKPGPFLSQVCEEELEKEELGSTSDIDCVSLAQ